MEKEIILKTSLYATLPHLRCPLGTSYRIHQIYCDIMEEFLHGDILEISKDVETEKKSMGKPIFFLSR